MLRSLEAMAYFGKLTPTTPTTLFSGSHQRRTITMSSRSRTLSMAAASSSSSAAQFSEQLLGQKDIPKRQRIAGIDQDEITDPTVLADPDSCFCEFKGVKIHHKICDAQNSLQNQTLSRLHHQTKSIGLPTILFHGFGASVFSWDKVMKPLAQLTGSKVLAFDRPAFGLTSRLTSQDVKPLNPYSIAFSVLATLYFIDFLAADKAILMGHSAGSLIAIESYFEAPERVAALILVSPAIVAPRTIQKITKENQSGGEYQTKEDSLNLNNQDNPFIRLCKVVVMCFEYIALAIMRIVKWVGDKVNTLYKNALSALLRSSLAVLVVRMIVDKFGLTAIRNAWYDSSKVTDDVLNGYTKPLRTKGWDRALVEHTVTMLTDSETKAPVATRLHEISCPVLIVTGDSDRIIPSWNAERLSRAIPGSCLEVIKHCGHLPHEERVEEFVSAVDNFLLKVFGTSEEPCVQAAAT